MDRKEAIKVVKNNFPDGRIMLSEALETLIPELKENEEEENRKWILEYLYDGLRKSDEQFKEQFKCAIDWLEKQGEQKHKWSEKDEKMIDNIIDEVYPYGECPDYPTDEERDYYYEHQKMVDWLESLKQLSVWKSTEE